MLQNLLTGTLMIIITVLVHTFGLIAVTRVMTHMTDRFRMHGHRSRVIAMISVVFGLFLVLTVEVWLWAACYWVLDALPDFEHALYFSTVTFSSLGYGDIVLPPDWRLFGAIEAANGLILCAWSTAFLISLMSRLRALEHDWLEGSSSGNRVT